MPSYLDGGLVLYEPKPKVRKPKPVKHYCEPPGATGVTLGLSHYGTYKPKGTIWQCNTCSKRWVARNPVINGTHSGRSYWKRYNIYFRTRTRLARWFGRKTMKKEYDR